MRLQMRQGNAQLGDEIAPTINQTNPCHHSWHTHTHARERASYLFDIDGYQMLGKVTELCQYIAQRAVFDEFQNNVERFVALIVVDILYNVVVT
jgi:hypothetical protein